MYCLFCHNKSYIPCGCDNGKAHDETCIKCNGFGNSVCLHCLDRRKWQLQDKMAVHYDILTATKVTC